MIAIHLVTSTVLGLVAAASVQTLELEGMPAATGNSPVTVEHTAPSPAVRVKRYCIKDRREGAEIRPKICRTRDDWRARGFDPVVAIGGV